MKKTFKKIAAAVMAAAMGTIALAGTTVSASTNGPEDVNISVSAYSSSWNPKSNVDAKDDNDPYAYYNINNGTVSSSKYLYFRLYAEYGSTANPLTASKKITSNSAQFTSAYTTPRGIGSLSYLKANAGTYSATAYGKYYA